MLMQDNHVKIWRIVIAFPFDRHLIANRKAAVMRAFLGNRICDIVLSENIAVDEFKKHKTMGELILIDRVSHMTSACGVVESTRGQRL